MSNEENVPQTPTKVDPEAFQRAVRIHNSGLVRKERLQILATVAATLVGVAICVIVVIWLTNWLIADRSMLVHVSDRPEYLVGLTAALGAIVIVCSLLSGACLAAYFTVAVHETVGFSLWSVGRLILITLAAAVCALLLITGYLAVVFYS